MRGLLKLIGYLVLLVVVLVVVAGVYLTLYFDPNEHKDQIVAEVKKATGRDLTIDGDIGLTVFPWLGARVNGLELSNAPGFGAQPFARVGEAEVSIKLLPLLKNQVEAGTVTLKGLELNLAKNANGQTNWDDLVAHAEAEAEQEQKKEGRGSGGKEQGSGAAEKPVTFAVGGVQIENARLVWEDLGTGERTELKDLNLGLSEIVPGKPVDVHLGVGFQSGGMAGKLALKTRLHPDPERRRYRLEGTRIELEAKGADLPEGGVDLTLDTDIAIDLEKDSAYLTNIRAATLGLELSGAIKAGAISQAPVFDGNLEVAPFDPRKLMQRLGQTPPVTADPEVLRQVALSTALHATTDSLEVKDLKLALDKSTLSGGLSVSQFEQPRIGFDLSLDRIDLDAYLPPPASGETAKPRGSASGAGAGDQATEAEASPLEALRKLNLDGSLSIGSLKVANLRTKDILVKVKAADGVLEMKPLSAALYDGQFRGSARLDARKDALHSKVNWKLAGIQVGPLLKDLVGEDRLLGTGNVSADLSMVGDGADAVQRTLDGTAAFSFTNGAYNGINIPYEIRKALAVIKGKKTPPKEPAQTDFSELKASFKIAKGIVHNDDLTAKSPLLRVTGKGAVDLPRQSLDYTLFALITHTLEGQGGRDLKELEGIRIPIRLTGPLADPDYAIQLDQVLGDKLQKELTEKAAKKLDKVIGEDNRKMIENVLPGLQGLFK